MDYFDIEINAERGRIPEFFFKVWKSTIGTDPKEDYAKEARGNTEGMGMGGLFCLIAGAGMIALSEDLAGIRQTPSLVWTALGSVAMSLGVFFIVVRLRSKDPAEGIGHMCYKSIGALFDEFQIHPTEEVGRLSQEEFRAYIEDALMKKAASVDAATGFAKIDLKNQFNRMHKAALEWGLCHRPHSHYYPKR